MVAVAKTRRERLIESLQADGVTIPPNLLTGQPVEPLAPAGRDIRAEDLTASLAQDGIAVIPDPTDLSPQDSFDRDEDIVKMSQLPSFINIPTKDLIDYHDALKTDESLVFPGGKIGFVETIQETSVLGKLPFVGSLYKIGRIGSVFDSAKILSGDKKTVTTYFVGPPFQTTHPVTEEDTKRARKIVEDWVIELEERQSRGVSIGGRIAEGITELPAFMVEFFLTGPIFKTGSATAKTAVTKVLGRYAEKGVGKFAVKVAGAGFGSLARTAVNVPRILEGAVEQMTPNITITDDGAVAFSDVDVNPFGALARSFADLYIENLTEIAGPTLKKGVVATGKGIGKTFPVLGKFTSELAEKWIASGGGVTRTMSDFFKASATKVGYHGILEEMGEEQLGRMLRSATGLQDFNKMIPSMEELLVEAGVFAVPGAISLSANKLFRKDAPKPPVERDLGKVTDEEFAQILAEPLFPIPPAPSGAREGAKPLKNQGPIGIYEEGLFLEEPPEELAKVIAEVRKNEGDQAANIVKELQDAGIETTSTHRTDKNIVVRTANLSEENRAILEQRKGVEIKQFEKVSGDYIYFGIAPTPTAVEQKIKKNTAETKVNAIKANVKESAVEPTGTPDAIRRNILRAEDAVGFWGTAGKKVQRDLREISARTAKNVGNTAQNVRAILKGVNAKDKAIISQLTDGEITEAGQPNRLIERARQLKEQLDIMQNEAIDVGLRTKGLTGKAFPQVPNKKGRKFLEEAEVKGAQSHRVFAWAQNQVTEGRFSSVDAAIASLQNYRRNRLRGTEGYFEGERTVVLDTDMREWNPDKILPGIIEGGWEAIEGARQWGLTKDGNFKDIRTSIERIRGEVGVDQARLLEDYIKGQYGQSSASAAARKWNKRARAVQFVEKLSMSPLTITRNMWDRYAKGFTHGTIGTNIRATIKFPPFLNKFMKTSQKIQDEMIRRGAVLGHGHLSEGFASGGAISQFLGKPFALSERGNQTYIALVKKLQLDADIRSLHTMGGKTGTVGKMYDRLLGIVGQSQQQTRKRVLTDLTNEQLADALAQKEISDDVMSEVLHRVVTDSAFPLTLASKRMWWGNKPFVQTMTQFKVWPADQMRFIYKDVLKYTAATGDPSRLARFIIGTWLAGEVYNIARDFLLGKDESLLSTLQDPDGRNVKEISKSVANALVDGGVVGMLADLTYGLTDWAFGPTVGSIESIAVSGFSAAVDPATSAAGLKKFLLTDVPAAKQAQGVLDRIDRTFFDENNLTENYAKWRMKSFDFRRKKGELSAIESTAGRVIFSRTKRIPGPRTLSLEMISRQVLVGDFEDAAEYMKAILKDAPADKFKEVYKGLGVSAKNRSPFGNIAASDIPQFLSKFSVENQAKGIKLQIKWLEGYEKATQIAIRGLIDEGYAKELGVKAQKLRDEIAPQIEKFNSTIDELQELLK